MSELTDDHSPYKGLVPYSEEDAGFFFGREADRDVIEANLIASRLTILYGPSGVGKSSILRAGVAHHLRKLTKQNLHEQGVPEFIVVVFNSWRDDPSIGLVSCIYDSVIKTFRDQSIKMIAPQANLMETVQAWTRHFDCNLLIILDQFEEYFLYHPHDQDHAFDIQFSQAVNRPDLRANFLISMREDGLSGLDRFKGHIPNIFNNYLRLEHLDFDAARDAVEKPIEQYNHLHPKDFPISIEPELIDAVLSQVKTGHLVLGEMGRGTIKESNIKAQIETPYLQLVMIRLWDEEISQNSRSLQLGTLIKLGGAQSIVRTHLDRVMRSLSRKDQDTATNFFQYLITPSGSKIAYPAADLIKHSGRSEEDVAEILKTLEDERVLRQIPSSIDNPDTVRYEIFHDVLALAILDWRSRFLTDQSISKQVSAQVSLLTSQIGFSSEQVSTLITEISTTFQPKPFDGRSPYKGLDYFEEEDAELFFGRDKLVDDLVDRVKQSRTVFVTGPSGSGKSSLVRAGLIHALKQGSIKNSDRWLYATIKPGRDPLEALALSFSRLKSPELANYFREHINKAGILHECAESTLDGRKDQRIVLFIDQFEEVFTQVSMEDERVSFLNLLTYAANVENGRVIILFAMRSDFVSNCATYPNLNALLNQQFVQIGAMQPDELVNAIAKPALRVGLRIDPDLVAQVINDMQGESGALPLMQFALKDLFDSQKQQGGNIALTLNDYLQRGGVRKALERHADDTLSKLAIHEQELARSIFSRLIEIGRDTPDSRRTALFDELVPTNIKAEDVETVVQKLADARLVTTDEIAGKNTVTISHEKLINSWPWLKKLVNENRDVIILLNEIMVDAREWEENSRDSSYLYSGARLEYAVERIKAHTLVLSGSALAYVQEGIAMQQAVMARQRRQRRQVLFVAIGLVSSIVINCILIITILR